jgi:hypothetical protein
MREPGGRQPAGEPVGQRKSPAKGAEIVRSADAATLRVVARSLHRGAWWRRVRREGLAGAPGVARALGILAVLSCLAIGGGVFLPGPLGLFRGGEIREGAVDRASDAATLESPSGMEIDAMRAMKMSAAVLVGSLAAAGAASAQTAVEWKVSEGGNGHWYQRVTQTLSWAQASSQCNSWGGHLATITSASENSFIGSLGSVGDYWLGGFQPVGTCEPSCDWRWVTGEPWGYSNWNPGQPDNAAGIEDVLAFYPGKTTWNDRGDGSDCITCGLPGFVLEWSADCNGDGIVDYGQILAGELDDTNANNIPDCCEQGTTCPVNIAANGSFEAGTPLNACTTETVSAGTSIGTGWQVTSGSVQRVRASSTCSTQGTPKFGDFFVDLLDAGEIRQTVATTPGRSYRLTFWLSGDCAAGPTTKRVTAALGTASQTFDHACSGNGTQAWRSCSLEFIANASITTLSLKSAAGGTTNGPLVDGVRVEDISISCPGDVDGDGDVNGGDISLVLLNFGECPSN